MSCFAHLLRAAKLPYCKVIYSSRLQWSIVSFIIVNVLGLIKITSVALLQVLLRKCWTIQTHIWQFWRDKCELHQQILTFQSMPSKTEPWQLAPNQWVHNNRCQWDKQTLVHHSVHPHTRCDCLSVRISLTPRPLWTASTMHVKVTLSPYYAQMAEARSLPPWIPSHLGFQQTAQGNTRIGMSTIRSKGQNGT